MSNVASRKGLRTTAISFTAWVGQAAPCEVFEYHRGFLAVDIDAKSSPLSWQERVELEQLAKKALFFSERNLVHLVQSRRAEGDYSYFAIVRRRPDPPTHAMPARLLEEAA